MLKVITHLVRHYASKAATCKIESQTYQIMHSILAFDATEDGINAARVIRVRCTWCHFTPAYLRLSSTPNTLSAVSSSGNIEGFLDALRLIGLPDKTACRKRKFCQAASYKLHKLLLLKDESD